ncbi:MAG TPA: decaprenyl-phosphate phosphoribosyltransferase [Acidimicrobiia bacterium]|jgi:decaprenyl-phosphate phosphoribosyltransferase|nr:decaprenyl-phosphate phosphoribosyltransferase [Acidimicrobiia bacterium]
MKRTGDDEMIEPEPRVPAFLRLARPKQWLKNVLVLAAPAAAGVLFEGTPAFRTAIAFVCFCLAASGTYYLNDAIDVEADRMHPTKRTRPVAAGEVAVNTAIAAGIGLAVVSVLLSFAARWQLALVIGGYLALTFAYTVWLKHEPVLDLAAVASGFVLRAIAGGIAVGVSISPWFLIVAAAGSLFMVTGKRSAELRSLGTDATTHRRSLAGYSESFLGYVRAVASSVAILAYCLWAFEKSAAVGTPAWFQLSIIPFALGILRYGLLLDQDEGDGAPEELVLSDRVLLVIGASWVVCFAVAVHGG